MFGSKTSTGISKVHNLNAFAELGHHVPVGISLAQPKVATFGQLCNFLSFLSANAHPTTSSESNKTKYNQSLIQRWLIKATNSRSLEVLEIKLDNKHSQCETSKAQNSCLGSHLIGGNHLRNFMSLLATGNHHSQPVTSRE